MQFMLGRKKGSVSCKNIPSFVRLKRNTFIKNISMAYDCYQTRETSRFDKIIRKLMLSLYSSLFATTGKNVLVPTASKELENNNLNCDYNMETELKDT